MWVHALVSSARADWPAHRVSFTLSGTVGLATADFDGDGDLDTVWGAAQGVGWLENVGGVPIDNHDVWFDVVVTALAVGDLDGDADQDLVVALDDGTIAWFSGDGAGRFRREPDVGVEASRVTVLRIADLDGDSVADVISGSVAGAVSSWRGTAPGFAPPLAWPAGLFSAVLDLDAGDLDGAGAGRLGRHGPRPAHRGAHRLRGPPGPHRRPRPGPRDRRHVRGAGGGPEALGVLVRRVGFGGHERPALRAHRAGTPGAQPALFLATTDRLREELYGEPPVPVIRTPRPLVLHGSGVPGAVRPHLCRDLDPATWRPPGLLLRAALRGAWRDLTGRGGA